jgi:hypothetical protein
MCVFILLEIFVGLKLYKSSHSRGLWAGDYMAGKGKSNKQTLQLKVKPLPVLSDWCILITCEKHKE